MESSALEYGEQIMDLSKAKEFMSKAQKNVLRLVTNDTERPTIVDQYGNKFEFTVEPKQTPPEDVMIKVNFKGIAESIAAHSDLICQIEYSMRGIIPLYTKKEIAKILDCVQYYSEWNTLWNYDDRTKKLKLSKQKLGGIFFTFDQALSFNFPLIGRCYVENCYSSVYICTDHSTTAIMMVFKQIFEQNGCSNLEVTYHPKISSLEIFIGTTVFVYQNSDQDSAIDSILDGAWMDVFSYWRINHICVHESIYKTFIEKLSKKISMLRWNLPKNYKPGKCIKNAKESIDTLLKTAADEGIDFITFYDAEKNYFKPLVILDNLEWFKKHYKHNIPIVLLQSFRTTKEAISLAKTLEPQSFSIWCDKSSIANELASAISATCIWINGFGHSNPSVNLEYRGKTEKFFRGGISALLGLPKHIDIDLKYQTASKNMNIENSIDVLHKSFEQWKMTTTEVRASIFLKIARILENESDIDEKFIKNLLESASDCKRMRNESLFINKSITCTEITEPVGIFVVKANTIKEDTFNLILKILTLGNGIIMLDENLRNKKVCEIFAKYGLPISYLNTPKMFDAKRYEVIKGLVVAEPENYWLSFNSDTFYDGQYSSEYYKMCFSNRKLLWNIQGETFSN